MSNDLGNRPRWVNEPQCQNEVKVSLYCLEGVRTSGHLRNRKYNRLNLKKYRFWVFLITKNVQNLKGNSVDTKNSKRKIFVIWHLPGGQITHSGIYCTYVRKTPIIRTHFIHWSRWWCQKWNLTPMWRSNGCFRFGVILQNWQLCVNIPINRKLFLSWLRWWCFRCDLISWWGQITDLYLKTSKCAIDGYNCAMTHNC